ncbi:cupin domain-containing protein [Kitasatospora sp. NPDC058201]|uniref:cupin domain-containing protein n=1 Tax=unclassified Kitasatospora TaxID=2633591 RepID=UPI003669112B
MTTATVRTIESECHARRVQDLKGDVLRLVGEVIDDVGHWHLNKSDILHFHHHGEPVTYHLLHPDGRHTTAVLGQDPGQGQLLTLAVPGGVWKASHLTAGDHALISEAVVPGFDYADMTLGRAHDLMTRFPGHAELVHRYCRPDRTSPPPR